MLEPDLETGSSVVDVYINTDSENEGAAVVALLDTLDVEHVVRRTLQTVKVEQAVTLTLVISGDSEIQALNRQYRAQDKPTDVLSFPLLDEPLVKAPADWLWQAPEEADEEDERAEKSEQVASPIFITPAELTTHLGDIMISWPTAQRQASEAGHPIADELLFLLCHGVLHLVGYDDQTEAGYTEMVRLQKEILAEMSKEG
ncbi:MAG TPA: rRNA maturation RNase YbeY [Ktedonobacteraceae bacterium]|jgi:probable rRNA maturation factor